MKFSRIRHFTKEIVKGFASTNSIRLLATSEQLRKIMASYADCESSLIPYGLKIYSQCDEDGIIREIFDRIGTTNKKFVEFGIGDGLENNTVALLLDQWSGLWIDMDSKSVKKINQHLHNVLASKQLTVVDSCITRDNINMLIADNGISGEIDLLSIDIDGNDAHIFQAIHCINPRCVVIEYNAKFGPYVDYCVTYDANRAWDGTDYFGASLKYLENLFTENGYRLVGCNITGSNAFFVRSELAEKNSFAGPYTSENHYQPSRYYLLGLPSGHPASYQTISKI